jgi:hypothetical protein
MGGRGKQKILDIRLIVGMITAHEDRIILTAHAVLKSE